jgi:hypothetical protein
MNKPKQTSAGAIPALATRDRPKSCQKQSLHIRFRFSLVANLRKKLKNP